VQSSKIESTLVDSLGIRLGAVASFVEEGASVLDIGTDHGYLPIGLIKSGKARHVIAGEVNKLPFLNAQASVAAEDEDIARRIEVRHGDGLAVLNDKGEVDTVTISGIGGVTIARILFGTVFPDSDVRVALHHKGLAQYESVRGAKDKRGEDGFRSVNDLDVQRLVLQPTSGWPSLRRTLLCHGWRIVDEVIHSEAGWLYITMLADKVDGVPSEEACNAVNLAHTLLGPGALMADAAQSEEEAALLTYWITRQRSHYQMRRDGIAKGKALATLQRTAAATLEGGEARRSAEQEPQDSESITHGNPGNLGCDSVCACATVPVVHVSALVYYPE
jgi:tRNA A22 N-methylase